jgi:pyridoxamine 5'-phosphate oxidase family protein
MSFTDEELAYLASQPLARIATVDDEGQPDVVPVGFTFDGTCFTITGFDSTNTRRHRNVSSGHHLVALVVDDLVSTNPWTPRYLRVYGTAEIVGGSHPRLRIRPTVSWSWNLSGERLGGKAHITPPKRTVHQ